MVKDPSANAGDVGATHSIPGREGPLEWEGHPLQCFYQESPRAEAPGGLRSMGLQGDRHDLATEK